MREGWTDDRLDDLNGKVDALRVEMKTEFAAVRGNSLNWMIILFSGRVCAALVAALAGLFATRL